MWMSFGGHRPAQAEGLPLPGRLPRGHAALRCERAVRNLPASPSAKVPRQAARPRGNRTIWHRRRDRPQYAAAPSGHEGRSTCGQTRRSRARLTSADAGSGDGPTDTRRRARPARGQVRAPSSSTEISTPSNRARPRRASPPLASRTEAAPVGHGQGRPSTAHLGELPSFLRERTPTSCASPDTRPTRATVKELVKKQRDGLHALTAKA